MKKIKKDNKTLLEKQIDRLEERMEKIQDQTSDEYRECQEMLEKLYEIQIQLMEKKNDSKKRIDPNTLIIAAGSLLEIILIMNHERLYVIATKAMSRVVRARL